MITLSPWVHTTDKCNMRCDYCYVRGDNRMTKEVYDAIAKVLPHNLTHIRMGGGEPLLVYDDWKDWVLLWNVAEVLTNFRHIPNGYFDLPVRTSVSIDGYGQKVLDKEMIRNLSRLNTQPWIMTTLGDLRDIPLLALFVAENKYGWSVSTDYFWNGEPSADSIMVVMHEAIQIMKAKDYNFNHFNFNNLDFGGRGGCCAGYQMFSIYCDGTIYPCQTLHKQSPLGTIFDGWRIALCQHERLACEGCSIAGTCTSWCPIYHTPGNAICDVMKHIVWEVKYAK